MINTVRTAIFLTFTLFFFGLVCAFVFVSVPKGFNTCKESYDIREGLKNTKVYAKENDTKITNKETECRLSQQNISEYEGCLASVALENRFPIDLLLYAGKISKLRQTLNMSCLSMLY